MFSVSRKPYFWSFSNKNHTSFVIAFFAVFIFSFNRSLLHGRRLYPSAIYLKPKVDACSTGNGRNETVTSRLSRKRFYKESFSRQLPCR